MTKAKKPSKRDLALDQVLRSLESLGFVPAGEIPTCAESA